MLVPSRYAKPLRIYPRGCCSNGKETTSPLPSELCLLPELTLEVRGTDTGA
jgi:hypothetical protein